MKKERLALYLHDVKISSSGNYPCINVDAKSTVYLVAEGENLSQTEENTELATARRKERTIIQAVLPEQKPDGAEETANWAKGDKTKGSIYTKGVLLISGSGSLNLNEGYKHGIYSKDYIRVFGGTINVNTSGRNAIQSVNGFIMDNGTITISGTGENTNNESRGIIVEGTEDTDNPGEGFIVINSGTITATTYGKAISAKWDIDDDAETAETTDDPYPYVLIKGGNITVTTTGKSLDESSSEYTFTDADGVTASEKQSEARKELKENRRYLFRAEY